MYLWKLLRVQAGKPTICSWVAGWAGGGNQEVRRTGKPKQVSPNMLDWKLIYWFGDKELGLGGGGSQWASEREHEPEGKRRWRKVQTLLENGGKCVCVRCWGCGGETHAPAVNIDFPPGSYGNFTITLSNRAVTPVVRVQRSRPKKKKERP